MERLGVSNPPRIYDTWGWEPARCTKERRLVSRLTNKRRRRHDRREIDDAIDMQGGDPDWLRLMIHGYDWDD